MITGKIRTLILCSVLTAMSAGALPLPCASVPASDEKVKAAATEITNQVARHYNFVVSKDGKGDFTTVQAAIDAVPDFSKVTTSILIRSGVYFEKVIIPMSKRNLAIYGEDGATITCDHAAPQPNALGNPYGTSGSSSVYIFADDFYCENVTFANTAGMTAGQAVAVLTTGDKMFFRNCRFLGFQDTLYTYGLGRQYYEDCYIEGSVDFIFGPATALFNRCEIRNKRSGGYITAPNTPEDKAYGFVFTDCRLTADPGVEKCWLARPWRDYGKTVYVRCYIGSQIRPEGWHNWGKPEREKTALFAEINCTGPGSDTSARAFGKVLKDASEYTLEKVLGGWIPKIPN